VAVPEDFPLGVAAAASACGELKCGCMAPATLLSCIQTLYISASSMSAPLSGSTPCCYFASPLQQLPHLFKERSLTKVKWFLTEVKRLPYLFKKQSLTEVTQSDMHLLML